MNADSRSPGHKASDTKGPEEEKRAGKQMAWTKAYGKNDALNPWSEQRYAESKAHFNPLTAKIYQLIWDGQPSSIGEVFPPRTWSTGARKDMNSGDRVLLLRQTVKPVGFVAMGTIIEPPRVTPHIDRSRRDEGATSNLAVIEWEYFGLEPLVVWEDLPEPLRTRVHWAARGGGQIMDKEDDSPKGVGLFIDQELRRASLKINAEDAAAAAIDADPTIGATERDALQKARIGQQIFRNNVLDVEKNGCRITGVSDTRLLRASHIKPWAESTNEERLDGHNGLMLTPTVDHLFDKGFISFADEGEVLISPRVDPEDLARLGVAVPINVGGFTPRQRQYLDFHRREVFERD